MARMLNGQNVERWRAECRKEVQAEIKQKILLLLLFGISASTVGNVPKYDSVHHILYWQHANVTLFTFLGCCNRAKTSHLTGSGLKRWMVDVLLSLQTQSKCSSLQLTPIYAYSPNVRQSSWMEHFLFDCHCIISYSLCMVWLRKQLCHSCIFCCLEKHDAYFDMLPSIRRQLADLHLIFDSDIIVSDFERYD